MRPRHGRRHLPAGRLRRHAAAGRDRLGTACARSALAPRRPAEAAHRSSDVTALHEAFRVHLDVPTLFCPMPANEVFRDVRGCGRTWARLFEPWGGRSLVGPRTEVLAPGGAAAGSPAAISPFWRWGSDRPRPRGSPVASSSSRTSTRMPTDWTASCCSCGARGACRRPRASCWGRGTDAPIRMPCARSRRSTGGMGVPVPVEQGFGHARRARASAQRRRRAEAGRRGRGGGCRRPWGAGVTPLVLTASTRAPSGRCGSSPTTARRSPSMIPTSVARRPASARWSCSSRSAAPADGRDRRRTAHRDPRLAQGRRFRAAVPHAPTRG